MPEMEGLEVTRRLRELSAFKKVPIVAISTSVAIAEQKKSLMAGVNVFLSKPINYGTFWRTLLLSCI